MRLRLFVMWLLVLPVVVWGQALSQRVPGDALIYVGWQGTENLQKVYQGTHLKAVVDNTTIAEFFDKGVPALVDRLVVSDPEAGAKLRIVLNLAGFATKHATALYVGAMEIKEGQPPMPRVAILCEAGAEAESLEKLVAGLLEQAGPAPVPMGVKRNGNMVALIIGDLGEATEALVMGRGAAGAQTLAANTLFQSSLTQVQKNAAMTVYVNTPGIIKLGDDVAAVAPPVAMYWPRVREALNFGGIQSGIATAGFDGKDWTEQAFIGANGPRTGLLAMFNGAAVGDDQLALVPASATWMCAGRFDFGKLWNDTLTGVEKGAPEVKQQLEMGVALVDAMLGFDISKDFVGAWGDKWTVYSAPNVGGPGIFGFTLINQVADAAKLGTSLDRVELLANQALDANQNKRDPQVRVLKTKVQGIDVHYVSLFLANPAWAIHDGKFYFTLMPQAIPAAVETIGGGNTIMKNEAFVAMRKRLGVEKPGWIEFLDLPRTAPASYSMLTQLAGLLGILGGADAPPTLVPPLNRLLPELTPAGSASWSDEKGWHMKSISPFPGSKLLSGQQGATVAGPAMLTAILLPALSRARLMANHAADAGNLMGIARSCIVYAVEHNDKMPEHLAELVAGGGLLPGQLVSKESGTTAAVLTAAQKSLARADWRSIEKMIDEHCDYVYLGKGMKNDTEAGVIIALDKPWLASDQNGVQCAYADGHVEWHPLMTLRDEFETTNRARKKLGLAEVNVEARVTGRACDRDANYGVLGAVMRPH